MSQSSKRKLTVYIHNTQGVEIRFIYPKQARSEERKKYFQLKNDIFPVSERHKEIINIIMYI